MTVLRLDHIRIYVTNIENSLAFYEQQLGLKCLIRSDRQGFALLNAGPSRLILEQQSSNSDLVGRNTGLSFSTDDVQAVFNMLNAKGVSFLTPLEKQHWGGWQALLADPDNNIIIISGQ